MEEERPYMKTLDELRRLLRWAKRKELYIEILWDGWTKVQWLPPTRWDFHKPYRHLASGKTLLQALRNAKKKMDKELELESKDPA